MKKFKFTKIAALILAGAAALGMTACAGQTASTSGQTDNTSSAAQNNELKTVRVGVPGFDDNPLLENGRLALKLGYIDEELSAAGYKLDLVTFQEAGPAINEAYSSGQLDLAVYGDLPASVCRSKGVDIKVIGSVNEQQNLAVIAGNDTGINSPKDLEGKKVIVGIGTNYHEYWQHLIDAYGIDESKVEIVNVVSDAGSVFTSGEADAWLTFYYNTLFYESKGTGKTIENTVEHPEMASQFLVTGRTEYLNENPEAAKAFLKALKRSQEYAVEHPEELYEAVASPTIGVEIYKKSYDFDPEFKFLSPEITEDTLYKLNYLSDFLTAQGFIKEPLDIDAFTDSSYYEAISE